MADLQELAGLAGGSHHAARALERIRHLFLAVHVLAGLEAVDRVPRVPEVGGGDDDGVECLLLVEHLAVVVVAVDLVLEPLEGVDGAPLVVLRPDVAHRTEAQSGDAQHRFRQHLALRPGAEKGDVDLLQVGCRRRRRGRRLHPSLLVAALFVPRVAEEPQRRDRGQAHEQISPIELSRAVGCRLRLPLALVVLASHRSSPALLRGASPLGLPYTLSRAPLRRRAPFAWLTSASAKATARPRRSACGAKAGASLVRS